MVLASLALGCAVSAAPDRVAAAARSAPVAVLVALAALGALSAVWTTGASDDALRWALVLAALAALVVAAAALPQPEAHACILLVVATGAALAGLVGAATRLDPLGLDVCGAWRPAGPLEYPPALALICVMGLPAAQAFATAAHPGRARLAVLCGWILVTTLAVSGSRTGVALAGLTLLATALLLGRGGPAAGLLLAVSGGLSALVSGGELGADGALVLGIALLPGVGAVLAAPRLLGGSASRPAIVRRGLVALLCLTSLAGVAAASVQERSGGCAYAGFGHGRGEIWRAAWRTGEQRPVQGFGLESFATASRAQQARVRAVPVQYAHALPLEAWVELGLLGVALVLALHVTVARAALRATRSAATLLAAPAIAFLAANLLDWSWHLAGCGVLWAIAVGGLVGSARPGA